MKTMEELLKEIDGSKELQGEFDKIDSADEMEGFLKKQNCGATVKEFIEFLKSRFEGSISDDDLEFATGGTSNRLTDYNKCLADLNKKLGKIG